MGHRTTFFEYTKCSTCRAARKALEIRGIEFTRRPLADEPPSVEELRELWQRSGLPLRKFFNTSGGSYRALRATTDLDALPEDELLRLLAADGMLVKRPLLDDGHRVLVGFDPAAYAALGAGR